MESSSRSIWGLSVSMLGKTDLKLSTQTSHQHPQVDTVFWDLYCCNLTIPTRENTRLVGLPDSDNTNPEGVYTKETTGCGMIGPSHYKQWHKGVPIELP